MATSVYGQNTNIGISSTVLQQSVKRFGINLGTKNFYDSGQTTKNLLNQNPGFEGQTWNSTIRCAVGTATSCTDEDQWAGWPAGFWNGATFEIFYGTAAGRTGVIAASTASANGQGPMFTFSNSGVAPTQGDYMIVHLNIPGSSTNGWWPATTGSGTIADNLNDLPPATTGKQTVSLTAPSAADSATISGYFDTTQGKTFLQLNGTYQVQFKAKGTGGSSKINVLAFRGGVATYLNQTIALSNSWNTYTLTFTAAETGTAIGQAGVSFSTVGADSFYLDDASLTQLGTDPANVSAFRDPVVNTIKTLQPGIIRYWGGQLGETLDNIITPTFGRQMSGYSPYSASQSYYGLHDFLVLCQLTGVEPWFVVPVTFTQTDATNLAEYLSGASTTPYGAKRAALGQTVPWSQVFTKIHLEFGNESWNPTFKGGIIEYSQPYGQRAQLIFSMFRNYPAYVASQFDLVLGGQAAWPGRNADIQNNCNNNDSFDVAPYTMNTVDSYSDVESLFGSTFAEPEAFMSSTGTAEGLTPGMVYQDVQAIEFSSHPVPVSFYEVNVSTLSGSITQSALNQFTPSLGAGLMVADTMLLAMQDFGIVNQNIFALPQYSVVRPDGLSALMWGVVVDMGVTNRMRPQFLAEQLANSAIFPGAQMLRTNQTGSNPTWNQPLTNTVSLSNAHFLQSYAFAQGLQRSLVIFNFSRTSALPVVFSDVNAPSGTVQMQQLTSALPTDNNETQNVVQIQTSTLNNFSPSAGLSLPPYSMTVLTWTGSLAFVPIPVPAAPVISAVASTISGTSATITWTTDQPSSSLVNFGTSVSYGSSSAASSALVTSHSVTLSGLTAATAYNFQVISVNANGAAATSSNYTFAIPVTATPVKPAPYVGYVAYWGITSSGITVSWSTDQPATTQLAYGTSSTLGQLTPLDSTMVLSHGVVLTGLTAGTTYYFVAQSSNAGGITGFSQSYSFTTQGTAPAAAPVISAVASAVSGTSAAITWTTDQLSSSLVNYGTTASYGSSSSSTSTLVTSHSIALAGLTPGTTYNFQVVSANAAGKTATSANYTFAVPSEPAPVIGNVTEGSITSTGISISWSTDQLATTQVSYGTSTPLTQMTNVVSTLVSSHSVTLAGLTPATTYYFLAQSANATGVTGTSQVYSFTTLAVASGATPVIASVASSVSGTSAVISWTTDQSASSLVNYGTSLSYGASSAASPALMTSHSVTLSGLTAGTTYNFQVVSANAAGITAASANYTLSVPAASTPSEPAPYVGYVAFWGITSSGITISWSTDKLATTQLAYGTTNALGQLTQINSTLVLSHGVVLTGLTSGTTYYFVAQSADSNGVTGYSQTYTFKTLGTAPGTPPVISAVGTAVSGTSATITWTTDQPTSSLVNFGTTTSYGSSSSSSSALVTSHSITLAGLTPGSTYNFQVVSANAGGMTTASANNTFATPAAVLGSQAAPYVGYVAFWGVTSSSVAVSWSTDELATTQLAYGTSSALGQLTTLDATMVVAHGALLTGLKPGTTYYFAAQSTNASGVTGYSQTYSFTTLSSALIPFTTPKAAGGS